MSTNQNFPKFYQKPVLLNRETHMDLTVSESPDKYLFASNAQTVLMASVEYFDACRQFPVVFSRINDGKVVTLALMGLETNENLFVDEKGEWTGSYIPAYIRRYPFITTDGADGNMAVCFDEAFGGFNIEGGIPLFQDGEPSPKMNEILAFLKNYYEQAKKTEQLGAFLSETGLLL